MYVAGSQSPKFKNLFGAMTLLSLLLLSFQNCSDISLDPEHRGDFASLSAGTQDGRTAFSTTFWPFMKTNCASCHFAGGVVSSKPFGDENLDLAFGGFSKVTPTTIKTKGTDGHGGTNTANTPENAAAIDEITANYLAALDGGGDLPTEPFTVVSNEFDMPATASSAVNCLAAPPAGSNPVTVTVNLETALLTPPTLPVSGTFTIQIYKATLTGGNQVYCLTNPRISAPAAAPLTLGNIYIKFNGQYVSTATTFSRANASAAAGAANVQVSASVLTLQRAHTAGDKVQFGFGIINN